MFWNEKAMKSKNYQEVKSCLKLNTCLEHKISKNKNESKKWKDV